MVRFSADSAHWAGRASQFLRTEHNVVPVYQALSDAQCITAKQLSVTGSSVCVCVSVSVCARAHAYVHVLK